MSSKIGTEVTLFAGFDVNTKNNDTDYQSGSSFHLTARWRSNLPLLGGFAGVGAKDLFIIRLGADSGSGATLGKF